MATLTEEHIDLVQKSWAILKKDLTKNGAALFLALFEAYPDYKDLFEQFRGISLEDLAGMPKLRAHGATFMHSLGSMVDNLGDLECVVELLRKRTQSHWERGIRFEHFQNVFNLLPVFLKSKLGDDLDDATGAAWGAAAGVMINVIEAELKTLGEKKAA